MAKKKLYVGAIIIQRAKLFPEVMATLGYGKKSKLHAALVEKVTAERNKEPLATVDMNMIEVPVDMIRKAYAALPDNAETENGQLKSKLAETAKDLIYARNEAAQTRLQLEALEKRFQELQSELDSNKRLLVARDVRNDEMKKTLAMHGLVGPKENPQHAPLDTSKGDEYPLFDYNRGKYKVIAPVPTMEKFEELQGQVTAQAQELEVLRSQLVQMENDRADVHHTLLPLYALYPESLLSEIVTNVSGVCKDYEAAFNVACADGYKGNSLDEFAQHVIITHQASETKARAYEQAFEAEKERSAKATLKLVKEIEKTQGLENQLANANASVQVWRNENSLNVKDYNNVCERLASAEDSLTFFSDLQAFPPYAEYRASVPEGTEPMTFAVWLNDVVARLVAWENMLTLSDKQMEWLDFRTMNGEISITIQRQVNGLIFTDKVQYERFSEAVVRLMDEAARNAKVQDMERDEEIPK